MVQLRGNSNRIDRMPRKITLNPVRNLPSPHFPSTVLFQPVVICSASRQPWLSTKFAPFPSHSYAESCLVFCLCSCFPDCYLSRAPFTCRSPHLGLDATLPTTFASFCIRFLLTPAPFLEWARKAAKSRCLTHLPWVGSVPVGKFDVASF